MKTHRNRTIGLLVFFATAIFLAGYMLFHGYFDQGHFETKQIEWSSSKHVAVLAKRWDEQALGGLTYFVIVDNHPLTPKELKHAYHSNAVVFAAMSDCLHLHWDGPNRLSVACTGSYLNQEYIDVEKRQSGDVTIAYSNISPETAQTFHPK